MEALILSLQRKSAEIIVNILTSLPKGHGKTTSELIEEVSKIANECKDQVPVVLHDLARKGKIRKQINKEKRAFEWIAIS